MGRPRLAGVGMSPGGIGWSGLSEPESAWSDRCPGMGASALRSAGFVSDAREVAQKTV